MVEKRGGISRPMDEFSLDAGIRMLKAVPDFAELITFLEESESGEPRQLSGEEMQEYDGWVKSAREIAGDGWDILRRTYELQLPDNHIARELGLTELRVRRVRRVALGRISQQWAGELDCL